ncbi:MAG: PcfJ domain-containing protein [Pseudomonas profundi]|uniref:PcfJ domain-containing protein n=1 Tax=Pseudomonas profundi TaxID=1981513 RepID=UPI0030038DC3
MTISTDSNGSLWIDLTGVLGHSCRLEISSWHAGVGCVSHLGDGSFSLGVFEDVGFTLSMLAQHPEASDWISGIPQDVMTEMKRLGRLSVGSQFSALWFLSRDAYATELFLSAPVLFFFMVRAGSEGQLSCDEILTLAASRRTLVLAACGLPPSRACLRFLAALPADRLYPDDLHVVEQFLGLPGWEWVNHLAYVDVPLLKWLLERPLLLGSRLLATYNSDWPWRRMVPVYDDILRTSRQLGLADGPQRVNRCRDMGEFYALHDRLVSQLNRVQFRDGDNVFFGSPPVPGTELIQPLHDARALHEEGVCQRHCIASYMQEITGGRYYAYRVLAPERATLGVRLDEAGYPHISQLKLKFNDTPSEATVSAVREWFEAALSFIKCGDQAKVACRKLELRK